MSSFLAKCMHAYKHTCYLKCTQDDNIHHICIGPTFALFFIFDSISAFFLCRLCTGKVVNFYPLVYPIIPISFIRRFFSHWFKKPFFSSHTFFLESTLLYWSTYYSISMPKPHNFICYGFILHTFCMCRKSFIPLLNFFLHVSMHSSSHILLTIYL